MMTTDLQSVEEHVGRAAYRMVFSFWIGFAVLAAIAWSAFQFTS